MADQKVSNKTLDPNASPYFRKPIARLYVHPSTYSHTFFLPPVIHPQHFWTYRAPITHRRQPPSSKKINFSLTPVASGPRIPKSRIKLVRFLNSKPNQLQWRPKLQDNKPNGGEKSSFEGKRWKNSRKEYHKVLPLQTNTTSLMIKNVPNKFTRKLLIQVFDDHCASENKKINNNGGGNSGSLSAFDFVYLPIDFRRRLNAGFAFVNFTNPEAALRFRESFHGKRWNLSGCSKIAEISRAVIQGKTALINHCRGMNFTHGSEEDMPVFFEPARDGSGSGSGSGQVHWKMFTVGKCFYRRK